MFFLLLIFLLGSTLFSQTNVNISVTVDQPPFAVYKNSPITVNEFNDIILILKKGNHLGDILKKYGLDKYQP